MNHLSSSILSGRQATSSGWGRTHQSECFASQASDYELLRRAVGAVADAGGRVYLVKDSRLPASAVARMYPGLEAWERTRDAMDPAGVLGSDLSTRLRLTTTGRAPAPFPSAGRTPGAGSQS